jgi:hypothetical protein
MRTYTYFWRSCPVPVMMTVAVSFALNYSGRIRKNAPGRPT